MTRTHGTAIEPEVLWAVATEASALPPPLPALREALRRDPSDVVSRATLLGVLSAKRGTAALHEWAELAVWFVENQPDSSFTGGSFVNWHAAEGSVSGPVLRAWRKHAKSSRDVEVLLNAAGALQAFDRPAALNLLERAVKLAPKNGTAHLALGAFLAAPRRWGWKKDHVTRAQAKRGVKHLEKAVALIRPKPKGVFASEDLAYLAFVAGDLRKAEAHAKSLVKLSTSIESRWSRVVATLSGHTMLGRIALARGDVAKAKQHLGLSLELLPFAPQPDHHLAFELLAAGEVAAVRDYLQRAQFIWPAQAADFRRFDAELRKRGTTRFE